MAKPFPRHTPHLPSYPSMKSMSGATGIPIDWLKAAKDKGCRAFKQNNSVNLEEWLRWLGGGGMNSEDDPNDSLKWSDKYARVRTWIAEVELSERRGEVVKRREVQEAVASGMAVVRGEMERIFCTELPPALKGLSELEIQRRCVADITRLMNGLRERCATLGGEEQTELVNEGVVKQVD